MELEILNNKGEKNGAVKFNEALVATSASPSVLHEVVVAYRAGLRAGTHGSKTRAQVSGGGIKPWKQKGTGRARSGSNRSPLWRKGGVIFGPVERCYKQDLPKSKKKTAFRMAIKELLENNKLQVVDPIVLSEPKTKNVAAIYAKWNVPTKSLLVLDKIEPHFQRASRNIQYVQITDVESLNTYDCLAARRVYITTAALESLSARISKYTEKKS